MDTKRLFGGCHCGKVKYQVDADLSDGVGVTRCNCSVCTKLNGLTKIVRPNAFELLSGEADVSVYVWGGATGTRYFCKHCGISCFVRGYLAEVGGDYVSVNCQTLDDVEITELNVTYWDGRHNNWEAGPRPTPWPMYRQSA
jgi:hypothetical protein